MTIDKQALREAAEKEGKDKWQAKKINGDFYVIRSGSYIKQCGITSYQPIAEIDHKPVRDFVAMVNPVTTLALLDENLQLQREKDAIEAVALALRDDMRQARKQLEAAEKRNAEQREYYEGVIADGSKRIAELESKNSNLQTIAHEQNELAIKANLDSINDAVEMDRLHKRIAELEAREISLPERSSMLYRTDFHEDYHTVMAYKVSDVIAAIRAAGIKVKGE
ncbi:ead/Ea22-like family protein [Salmonella enterica]|nr:ead/Ea22-like family protein [Salmonella enterica]EGQ6017057.1 ead/Ea22-like family protein [Salmonella enterica subsp. enterica serovar Sandiego]EEH9458953.1 ead/Ea22-like family protein [Salmonella enterica]EIN1744210.1 ead/Ea22-like family protein [Salmonella enterica]EKJ6433126.1 ead/Ea22-like family protein [Salmonella enterica]